MNSSFKKNRTKGNEEDRKKKRERERRCEKNLGFWFYLGCFQHYGRQHENGLRKDKKRQERADEVMSHKQSKK